MERVSEVQKVLSELIADEKDWNRLVLAWLQDVFPVPEGYEWRVEPKDRSPEQLRSRTPKGCED